VVEEETQVHQHCRWSVILALAALEQSQGEVLGQTAKGDRIQALGFVALLGEKAGEPQSANLQAQQHPELRLQLQVDGSRGSTEEQGGKVFHKLLDRLLASPTIQTDGRCPRRHRVLRLRADEVPPVGGLHAGAGQKLVGLIPQAGQSAAIGGSTSRWQAHEVASSRPLLTSSGARPPSSPLRGRLDIDVRRQGFDHLASPLRIPLHVHLAAPGSGNLPGPLIAAGVAGLYGIRAGGAAHIVGSIGNGLGQ